MSHISKCEEKHRNREEKREAKKRHREEKRKEKQRHREEKRELKHRHREEKRRHREEFVSKLFNLTLDSPSSNNSNNLNVQITSSDRIENENEVATLRTIFPDCDPLFIRNCLANETGDDRLRKVAENLLITDYPKVAPVSPLTPPTAPPLLRSSFESPFDNEAPPSYEESLGNQPLQPPPLPTRHQRASSWNGNGFSVTTSRSTQFKPCQIPQQISQQITQQITRTAASASSEVSEAISTVVKNLLTSMKPSTVDRAHHKYNHVWSRPVPSQFKPKPLSQEYKVVPKDKFSIQKGFNQCNYPSKGLKSHDISEEDWYYFMNGLNSLIGVKSNKGNLNNFGEGVSVSLKWVSWMNVTMDESLMETNLKALNEYIDKWNKSYFNPRQIMVQLIDNRNQNNPFKNHPYEQYLLVKSI
ncbi:hypothetical protein RhiirA5_361877 [Rhizophagus irregularis]|uniref:CUE domain-containing protein n=2 Tax=Rhizophagus irregularis TaxID=588596 RepID=A0A2I1ECG5_9GLOM|nr:hypothetical protein GLOIN_2v1522898 [Rhizophagus irregularis DAOM 181602=DAOM 197198]PKC04930.1 hypothetical protein RhiirA5_361877 [Rhizophagus irregularis]PKC61716.1 hypothetical protein RhiirA1_424608 [Rhizophagus irregularis]PKY19787.1 hypothetical protein RhiirB3_407337 [Rhizophagus irregularis]POG80003.1 hypothetical protein GLOIN_2v1522898 [Rhizophagus irregularis DAOM 181602=DAOM 197198]UZO22551.1 hypothetical protein OCT59_014913 [Rhizophagus irregularis]|eukprot:XP_025186869.1 hypothetical protein GLOIN_2v1522898 [Rhizophagus irregularis DAOM 181602=DAOM 197198]